MNVVGVAIWEGGITECAYAVILLGNTPLAGGLCSEKTEGLVFQDRGTVFGLMVADVGTIYTIVPSQIKDVALFGLSFQLMIHKDLIALGILPMQQKEMQSFLALAPLVPGRAVDRTCSRPSWYRAPMPPSSSIISF